MEFNKIDPTIRAWALKDRLQLSNQYKDSEVRSLELVGSSGRAQIWIEVDESITVKVWDYRKRKQSFAVDIDTLETALDQALIVALDWCEDTESK